MGKVNTGKFATREEFVTACKHRLTKTSKTMKDIAAELGCTVYDVSNVNRRYGLERPKRRRRSKALLEDVIEYQRRHPMADVKTVVSATGCAQAMVSVARHEMGYDYNKQLRRYHALKMRRLVYYIRKEMDGDSLPPGCRKIAARLTARLTAWKWFKYQTNDLRNARAFIRGDLSAAHTEYETNYCFLITQPWTTNGLNCLQG